MKFATKVFFCVLVLVLLGFDAMGYWLLQRSYQLNQDYTVKASQTEFSVVANSVQRTLVLSQEQFTEANEENIRIALAPYAEFYARQGVYFALYIDGTLIYSGMPDGSVPPPSAETDPQGLVDFATVGETLYLFSRTAFDAPLEGMSLVYIKDVQSLAAFQTDMARTFAILSIVVGLVLAALLFVLLTNLTRPFRRLNAAATEISQGNYRKRADVKGRDEVADFAQSFNAMAASVEGHVHQLMRMSDEKERYIANMSHELRTPVTAILGYSEVLQIGNCSDEERRRAADYLMEQSRRLKNLSSKLMDLTSMESAALECMPIDLDALLARVEATLDRQLKEKGVTLKRDPSAATIQGDAALVESLFQNLVENAVRASHDGGTVEIATDGSGEGVRVSIVDHGDGMEDSEREKVLEPFYRVDKARSREEGGAGLGLTLCARICKMQGARLTIDSEVGKGTEVAVDFTTRSDVHDGSETRPRYDG